MARAGVSVVGVVRFPAHAIVLRRYCKHKALSLCARYWQESSVLSRRSRIGVIMTIYAARW